METRILVIEDDERRRYFFSTLLERAGFQVIQARDGYEGLQAARQSRPALILLDILLPGMGGYVLAQELRKDARFARVPILAVNAIPMLGNRARALEAGCTAYIEKPINPAFLVDMVKAHLRPDPGKASEAQWYH